MEHPGINLWSDTRISRGGGRQLGGIKVRAYELGETKWCRQGGEGTPSADRQKGEKERVWNCGIELVQEENVSGPLNRE